ncbi:MAG: NAD(P)-dependent glycerol-3-phosphate dehydrogenase [Betaproteobacteria bacterium]|nr:NAD(P)-dependent glycerol-3-phosphate dehydrogenase [Pseudomonadota bacterium]NBO04289.1 NAD(P)-dependent glycerol-3-phosphate dehydrogenase [Betaproteobacteria bacterium]NBP34396.1 NAD(P)-dependent glycerol-3-phosphate dehydrogenase [Betaproteobacteria bacterium]NBP36923.1 NAD(P)-dependent glycerol-3-phosphate dehydrogenase [Betaproteobacteria bacterium]NBQ77430.1 NAD(P)-dependent glycerol-3-phosphate dehydrogenase [Betaproteobacteria bacterium]
MRIAVIGAGAWGTALAIHMAGQHAISLWARDPDQARALQAQRENKRYLPGFQFPAGIEVVPDLEQVLAEASLWVLAVPMSGLRERLAAIKSLVEPMHWPVLLWLCKGLERDSGLLAHEVLAQSVQGVRAGALSGPSFAQETAQGLPVAVVVASAHEDCASTARQAMHHGAMRVYANKDLIGVELGGALKNVMAIAAGVSDGLGMGNNARAALLTRGLAEISRLGETMGAKAQTFMGLTGLGDLLLTATGSLSRNRQVGFALAQGESTENILARLGHVAEGVHTAEVALRLAARFEVEMPITEAVHRLLRGELRPDQALQQLLARAGRQERDGL